MGRPTAKLILDTANTINGANADTSIVYPAETILTHAMPAATTLSIQVKLKDDEGNESAWVEVATVAADAAAAVYQLPGRYDQVRVVRTGAGNVVVWAARN